MTYEARRQAYLETVAAQDELPAITAAEVANLIPREVFHLLPRLETGQGNFDDALLAPALERIAGRRDCADFALAGLLRVLCRYPDSRQIAPEQKRAIEDAVLGFCYWYDQPGVRGMCFHTENHQILFHGCELLAGQLFPDRAFANSGKTGAWHREHGAKQTRRWMNERARFGFSEWLSCYIEEDLLGLLNLHDFAADPDIRRRARMLVDMLLFEAALHSHRGVLGCTHGRTYAEFLKGGRHDPNTALNWLVFGTGAAFGGNATIALTALATSDYRCPPLIEAIARDTRDELVCRERHGLNVEDAPAFGLHP
jgi:hypothetical protein